MNFGTFSKSFSYSYDARGNKETFVSPEGTAYTYGYDKNNQLTSITFLGRQVVLDYDRGRLWKTAFPNGLFTEYGYNDASWLSSMTRKNAGGTVEENGYGFDKIGNIISKGSGAGSSAYGYDLTYQLTSATHQTLPAEGFSYDDAGNRTASSRGAESASYSHNGSNETQAAGSATFTYDANGNTVSKTEGEATTTFVYNSADRLEQVFLPDGSTATYTYDPFGRRIKKDVNGEITYYLYSDEGLIGEYDASGNAEKGYGWKPDGIWGSDPLFMTEDGNYYFYQNDHLGTPQKMIDGAGNIVWAAEYTAFGEAVIDPTSIVENNLRFPGQYFDEETGLHYNWQRYYDPMLGRYVTADPLGLGAGDVNLYRYALNNPANVSDVYGLMSDSQFDHLMKDVYPALEMHKFKYGRDKGFDCSAFVDYAHKSVGISITNGKGIPTTRDMLAASKRQGVYNDFSNRSSMKKGDVLYLSYNGKDVQHVAIYVGVVNSKESIMHMTNHGLKIESIKSKTGKGGTYEDAAMGFSRHE